MADSIGFAGQYNETVSASSPIDVSDQQTSGPQLNAAGRVIKRRNRQPVSCNPCRARRSKCNRGHPCETCEKRAESHLCVYAAPVNKHQHSQQPTQQNGQGRPTNAGLARVQQLEEQVMQLLQKQENSPTGLPTQPQNGYVMQGEDNHSPDRGGAHWTSILQHIHELKSIFDNDQIVNNSPDGIIEAEARPILLGIGPTPSLAQILQQYLPTKNEIDLRLSRYFRAPYMGLPLTHTGEFQSQYAQFWQSPATTDPTWVGLLFSLLSISAHMVIMDGNGPEVSNQQRFQNAAALCLNVGGYVRPKKFLIPALVILAQSLYLRYFDPCREAMLIMTLAIRLAYQAGLHREPPASCSIFEAEMRRRQWVCLVHFDIQLACQFGVPNAIPYNSYDTSEPQHLLDVDLSPEMTVLPPARSLNETTAMTSFQIKTSILHVLSEIYYFALSVNPEAPYLDEENVKRLDEKLRKVHADIPATYKIRPASQSVVDQPFVIMGRLVCEFLAQKSFCILHRQQMANGNEESKRACMAAASKIVYELTEFVVQLRAGGLMEGYGWMFSSIVINDFLLASMILCLGVSMDDRTQRKLGRPLNKDQQRERAEQLDLLKRSEHLCSEITDKSRGAGRVGDAINLLRSRLDKEATVDPALGQTQQPTPPISNGSISGMSGSFMPTPTPSSQYSYMRSSSTGESEQARPPSAPYTHAAPMPLPPVPIDFSGITYDPTQSQGQNMMTNSGTVDPFEKFMTPASEGGAGDVDWTAFDQYITAGDAIAWDSALSYDNVMGGRKQMNMI